MLATSPPWISCLLASRLLHKFFSMFQLNDLAFKPSTCIPLSFLPLVLCLVFSPPGISHLPFHGVVFFPWHTGLGLEGSEVTLEGGRWGFNHNKQALWLVSFSRMEKNTQKSTFSRGISVVERRENCVPSWHFLENPQVCKLSRIFVSKAVVFVE